MTDITTELRVWAKLIGTEPRGARELFNRAADEIERLTGDAQEGWEYAPGHRWIDREGNEQWFVQAGRIKPSVVDRFVAEGGEVIRRRVGPWEVVSAQIQRDQRQEKP